MLANLASQLFEHGRITTTETRAKRMQPLAEKLITKAKRGDLHSRRIVLKTITDQTIVHVLFTEIAPTLMEREGGYTRITKVGNRKGDNAPMAVIEIVTEAVTPKAKKTSAKATAAPVTVVETVVEDQVEAADTDIVDEVVTEIEVADEAADEVEATEAADETESK